MKHGGKRHKRLGGHRAKGKGKKAAKKAAKALKENPELRKKAKKVAPKIAPRVAEAAPELVEKAKEIHEVREAKKRREEMGDFGHARTTYPEEYKGPRYEAT